jgi:hypothetical protein
MGDILGVPEFWCRHHRIYPDFQGNPVPFFYQTAEEYGCERLFTGKAEGNQREIC